MAAPYDCPSCGQVHPKGCHGHVDECIACEWRGNNHPTRPCVKCGGEVRQRPCRRPPRKGGTLCSGGGANNRTGHGGSPAVEAKAARNVERQRALGEVGRLMAEVRAEVGDVLELDGMEQALLTSGVMMRVYRSRVELLDLEPAVDEVVVGESRSGEPITRLVARNAALFGPNHLGDAAPHVLVDELHRWTRLHGELCKNAVTLGIEQRQVELRENEARTVARVLEVAAAGMVAAVIEAGLDRVAAEVVLRDRWPGIARRAIEAAVGREETT